MKKFVSLLVIIALIASLSVAFTACNQDDQKASNSETLGTAVATVAQMTGAASASSAAEAQEAFEAGINFDLSADAQISGTIGESIQNAMNTLGSTLSDALSSCVNGVSEWVGESNVDITTGESDKADYNEKITITFTHGEGEDATQTTFGLYVKVNEADKTVDSKEGYTFTAALFWGDVENAILSISGTATYSEQKGSVVFGFDLGSFAQFNAYATEDGKVAIDFGADIGVATLDFEIEVGKLADGTYGASVSAAGEATLLGMTTDVSIAINVNATGTETAGQFDIDGSFNSTIIVPLVGSFGVSATLDGQAVADVDGNFQVGLTGSLDIQAVEAEQE